MKIIFRNKEYQTLGQCYNDNKDIAKISQPTFVKRVREGESILDALSKPKGRTLISHLGSHTVEGVEYENLPSIARAYGIKEMTIYRRHHRGFRGDDLVPLKKRRNYVPPPPPEPKIPVRQVEIDGVTYKSIAEACRRLGVKLHTYKNRRRIGCSIEQCLNIEPYKRRRKTYEIDGEHFVIEEIEKRFGITHDTFYYRLSTGMTAKEAVTKKPTVRRKSKE